MSLDRTPTATAITTARTRKCSFLMIGHGRFALLDYQDWILAKKYLWVFGGQYAQRRWDGRTVKLHRWILGNPNYQIDHKNRNKLDCRRVNLRAANKSKNAANTGKRSGTFSSQFKGVSFDRERGLWLVQIRENGKKKHIGRFPDERKAAVAYNSSAKRQFGEFAHINPL